MAEVFQIISDYKILYLMKKRRNGIIDDEINIGYMEVKHTFKISDPWIDIVDLACPDLVTLLRPRRCNCGSQYLVNRLFLS